MALVYNQNNNTSLHVHFGYLLHSVEVLQACLGSRQAYWAERDVGMLWCYKEYTLVKQTTLQRRARRSLLYPTINIRECDQSDSSTNSFNIIHVLIVPF